MSKKLCPRCEQGWVVPIRIVATGQTIQFCMECDAVWDIDVETLRADRYSEFGEDVLDARSVPGIPGVTIQVGINRECLPGKRGVMVSRSATLLRTVAEAAISHLHLVGNRPPLET